MNYRERSWPITLLRDGPADAGVSTARAIADSAGRTIRSILAMKSGIEPDEITDFLRSEGP
jgi:hypothetical protein